MMSFMEEFKVVIIYRFSKEIDFIYNATSTDRESICNRNGLY